MMHSDSDYYLLQEFGGFSLLEFVNRAHRMIQSGALSIAEWTQCVQVIFKEMVECIEFMHSKNVCHFDVSLENVLINDVRINFAGKQIKFVLEDIQIKICGLFCSVLCIKMRKYENAKWTDFGLAELFFGDDSCSTKHCGKTGYHSPEIANRSKFDAKCNDVFCLGVCLWTMLIGSRPFGTASESDSFYLFLSNGFVDEVLTVRGKRHFADKRVIHLFAAFFQDEAHRITIGGIKKHQWFRRS